jgi:hypothetical protein
VSWRVSGCVPHFEDYISQSQLLFVL